MRVESVMGYFAQKKAHRLAGDNNNTLTNIVEANISEANKELEIECIKTND